MNCIIIDDDIVICTILEDFITRTSGLQLKNIFHDPISAINNIKNFKEIDVIFLDMEMPNMSGLEFLSTLIYAPKVIFISSNKEYAIDAFDYNAIDFLLKPIEYPRFVKAIQKIKEKNQEDSSRVKTNDQNIFFFKKKNTYYKVLQDEIIWIEAHDNYTKIITCNNTFLTNNTLKSYEDSLPESTFIRTHRSYIINKSYLSKIEENTLFLEYDKKISAIPLSKMYKDIIFNSSFSFK